MSISICERWQISFWKFIERAFQRLNFLPGYTAISVIRSESGILPFHPRHFCIGDPRESDLNKLIFQILLFESWWNPKLVGKHSWEIKLYFVLCQLLYDYKYLLSHTMNPWMTLDKTSHFSEPQLPHLYEEDSNNYSIILPHRAVTETNKGIFENTVSFRVNVSFLVVKNLLLIIGKGNTLAYPSLAFPIWHASNVEGRGKYCLKILNPSLKALNNKPKAIWPFSP